jgi:hypothetical protein
VEFLNERMNDLTDCLQVSGGHISILNKKLQPNK